MSVPDYSRYTQLEREWFAESVLGARVDAFVQYLIERGYAARTITSYLSCVAHFSHWLAHKQVCITDFSEVLIADFLSKHLPNCRCAPRCRRAQAEIRAALRQLLELLRTNGECRPRSAGIPAAIAEEIEAFDDYLINVCGLSLATRSARVRQVRDFLIDRLGTGQQLASLLPSRTR